MAITQPTYPTTTSTLVSHVGTYTDARETAEVSARNSAIATHEADTSVHGLSNVTKALGTCVYSGGSYPSRPTGFAAVIWIGPTDPGGSASDSDLWAPTA